MDDYQSIVSAIYTYRNTKIDEQMLSVPLKVSDALLNCGYNVSISLNETGTKYLPSKDTLQWNCLMYPGYNQFDINLNYKDSTNYYGSPANFVHEQFFDSVNTETKSVLLDWRENKVSLTIEH